MPKSLSSPDSYQLPIVSIEYTVKYKESVCLTYKLSSSSISAGAWGIKSCSDLGILNPLGISFFDASTCSNNQRSHLIPEWHRQLELTFHNSFKLLTIFSISNLYIYTQCQLYLCCLYWTVTYTSVHIGRTWTIRIC